MQNQSSSQSPLRFDHREIAVIFSLFVFVSLLMFTVGILVGKGLAQAKYEGALSAERLSNLTTPQPTGNEVARTPTAAPPTGSSVTTETEEATEPKAPVIAGQAAEKAAVPAEKPEKVGKNYEPLKLTPQKPKEKDIMGDSLLEPAKGSEADQLLKNPRIQSLLEDDPKAKKHRVINGIPESFSEGKFVVQVGSYPSETEANERVEALKKMGFPYANFSAKHLGESKETWYRVYLGFYPDYSSANDSGKLLKERGEVKHYLVRKSDNAG